MRYAVNLADLLELRQRGIWAADLLALPLIQSGQVVQINRRRVAGVAVILDCDEERAAAVIAVLRKKLPRNRLRCYRSKTGAGSWKGV